jgi:hypothetical protein
MLCAVTAIDVVDSTWVAARPTAVAAIVAEPANWARWWPGLDLVVAEMRGDKGIRWTVRAASPRPGSRRVGDLAGTAEVWLEPAHDGVVAHFFLRLDPRDAGALSRRRAARVTRHYRARTKRALWAVADELDPGRLARLTASGAR